MYDITTYLSLYFASSFFFLVFWNWQNSSSLKKWKHAKTFSYSTLIAYFNPPKCFEVYGLREYFSYLINASRNNILSSEFYAVLGLIRKKWKQWYRIEILNFQIVIEIGFSKFKRKLFLFSRFLSVFSLHFQDISCSFNFFLFLWY